MTTTWLGADPQLAGERGEGYSIPKGSLDIWKAARDASAATRCEVCGFGDSLMFGDGASPHYSFVKRLRERSTGAGFVDGGNGWAGYYWLDQTTGYERFGSEPAQIAAITGFGGGNPLYALPGPTSVAAGDSVTFNCVGDHARLWWMRFTQGGQFSYQVNAQAPVTVAADAVSSPPRPVANIAGNISSPDMIMLGPADGMTSGTNTITVVNIGGVPAVVPTLSMTGTAQTGAGNVPVGTYYYKATMVTGGGAGETTPSAAIGPVTVSGSAQAVNVSLSGTGWQGSYRLYRATSSGGPYGLVGAIQTVGSDNANFPGLTDNTATPGAAPPSSNTAGLNPKYLQVSVGLDQLKSAGIVWHNHGLEGEQTVGMGDVLDHGNNAFTVAALGLQWGTGTPAGGVLNGVPVGTASELLTTPDVLGKDSPIARTAARKIKLCIIAFGTNDIERADLADATTAPTAIDGGVGIGSGLAAATYYYKYSRVTPEQVSNAPLSSASAGTAITAGHQAIVSLPSAGQGAGVGAVAWNIYRATSSGGTYGFVGQAFGSAAKFIDNVATPGGAPTTDGTRPYPSVDTSITENALALGIRLARNAGADPLVLLPQINSFPGSRVNGATVKRAMQTVAETMSCAWVDLDVPLGPSYQRSALGYWAGQPDPHLPKPAYVAQGDFIWDKVLSK